MSSGRRTAIRGGALLTGPDGAVRIVLWAMLLALLLGLTSTENARAADSMIVQPDGKLVLAGGDPEYGPGDLIRLDGDGSLDPSFGEAGIVRESRATGPYRSVALMPGGEIVAGGRSHFAPEGFPPKPLFSRFLSNGKTAPNFGAKGLVEASKGGQVTTLVPGPEGSAIAGITEWTRAGVRGGGVESINGSIIEVGPSGALSAPLGAVSGGSVSDLVTLFDGSLVAAGGMREPPYNVQLAHFVAGSGSKYDPTFGEGEGLVSGTAGVTPNAERIVDGQTPDLVSDQGQLLVLGGEFDEGKPFFEGGKPLLARFSDTGVLDTGFGEGGALKPTLPGFPWSVASAAAVQPNGRIVVAFTTLPKDYGVPTEENKTQEVFLERFLPDGTLDSSFGDGGVIHVARGDEQFLMVAEDLALLPGGQIVLSGETPDGQTLIAARLAEEGTLDTGFGERGITSVTPCPGKGCGPEVGRSSVKLKYLGAQRKPLLMIHLRASGTPGSVIRSVHLTLPRSLRLRPKEASGVGATPEYSEVHLKLRRGSATVEGLQNRYVKIEFGYGALRILHRIGQLSHRPIHLKVGVASCPCVFEWMTEATQRRVLHLPRVREHR